MTEFQGWGKTARLFRNITITEKIDGTNAQIVIEEFPAEAGAYIPAGGGVNVGTDHGLFNIKAGSKSRYVTPEADNHGFARWVWSNADELVKLGPGRHFGEWWGSGIQRGYGLRKGEKWFSLFNTKKWDGNPLIDDMQQTGVTIDVVPVLYEGPFSEVQIKHAADLLQSLGSSAAMRFGIEFLRPEGVCIYHQHSGTIFKYTPYHNEDGHKG